MKLLAITAGDPPQSHNEPVARVRLDESVNAALSALEAALPGTEFTPAMLDSLRRAYAPGTGMADAFGRWLESVLGSRGLIVFDASDAGAKPLVAHIFASEIEQQDRRRGSRPRRVRRSSLRAITHRRRHRKAASRCST